MAETYEMYSGTATDTREYDAADFAAMFSQWFSNGVVYGALNGLEVVPKGTPDMSVNVSTGYGWVQGQMVKNDDVLNLPIDANGEGQPRTDRIVMRNDITGDGEITIEVLKGVAGSGVPALTQTGDTWEESLAKIVVTQFMSDIDSENITDERTYAVAPRISPDRLVFDTDLDMGGELITSVAPATGAGCALTKLDVDTYASVYYPLPTGAVVSFGVVSPPTGFLACDGSAVSRTTYAALFAVCGTVYGVGDGSTTFNLPNLQTKIVMGHSGSGDYYYMGDTGGEATHQLTAAELPAHNHGITFASASSKYGTFAASSQEVGTSGSGTSGSTGGDSVHDNMPPYILLKWGIKT